MLPEEGLYANSDSEVDKKASLNEKYLEVAGQDLSAE
jgi:hypothetical protein